MSTTPLISDTGAGADFKLSLEGTNEDVRLSDRTGEIVYRQGWQESNIQLVLTSSALLVFKKDAGDVGSAKANLSLSSIIGTSSSSSSAGGDGDNLPGGKEMTVFHYEDTRNMQRGCMSMFGCGGAGMRRRQKHVFTFPTVEACKEWTDHINTSVGISKTNPRKFLVFLNPVSGPGQSQHLYDSIVKGMLEEAYIEPTLVVTERQNHAYDICTGAQENQLSSPLQDFSVIMVIGGDGLLYEVINGLAKRKSDGLQLLQQIPIAPIPGGTGNGLAKSILYESDDEPYSILSSVFVAIKGVPSPLDLSVVNTKSDTMYSFLAMSWGLISDVDIGSEPMRWMGEARLHVAAVYYILSRRFYSGRLLMELADDYDHDDDKHGLTGEDDSATTAAITIFPEEEDFLANTPKEKLKIIDGKFQLIWVLQTPYAAATIYSGPGAQLDDGVFTILVVQDMSTVQLLQLLVDIDTGAHVKAPEVQIYKAKAYRLEPFAVRAGKEDDQEYRGILVLDGESIDGPRVGPIQSKVLPGAARILKLPS